ncbi:collagen alpha-1(I) chain-like, partial [Cebus imitator]|uniref:collagen alpha-1(I) chain-like n=1 Tax=Cebus imitator TaxID=2715852 RepID=UPI00189B401E
MRLCRCCEGPGGGGGRDGGLGGNWAGGAFSRALTPLGGKSRAPRSSTAPPVPLPGARPSPLYRVGTGRGPGTPGTRAPLAARGAAEPAGEGGGQAGRRAGAGERPGHVPGRGASRRGGGGGARRQRTTRSRRRQPGPRAPAAQSNFGSRRLPRNFTAGGGSRARSAPLPRLLSIPPRGSSVPASPKLDEPAARGERGGGSMERSGWAPRTFVLALLLGTTLRARAAAGYYPRFSPFFFLCTHHGELEGDGEQGEVLISLHIAGNPTYYVPGQEYHVTISTSTFFDGLLVTGLYTSTSVQASQTIGGSNAFGFGVMSDHQFGNQFMCSVVASHVSHLPTTNLSFVWIAPPAGTGCVNFMATATHRGQVIFKDALAQQLCEQG